MLKLNNNVIILPNSNNATLLVGTFRRRVLHKPHSHKKSLLNTKKFPIYINQYLKKDHFINIFILTGKYISSNKDQCSIFM